MQAAASRAATVTRDRGAETKSASTPMISADDTGLLDALPIAAAVIERGPSGKLIVASYNSRFAQAVDQSTCSALDWNDAQCLKEGPIAETLRAYFAGEDTSGDLDFRDGDGAGARYFRMKLAPLPHRGRACSRCLLSVVDRTLEVQAERTLRAEMLRDSLTGLPNRLAFTEAIEQAGDKAEEKAGDLEHAVLVVDML